MAEWKMPELPKVYEAMTAVDDGRVELVSPGQAVVRSSDGTKAYTVRWVGLKYSSSDPMSRFHGVIGYPILAVLIARGLLACDPKVVQRLGGVPWKTINHRHRNDYAAAAEEVLSALPAEQAEAIRVEAALVLSRIAGLGLER